MLQRSCASFNRLEWYKLFSLCACPGNKSPVAAGLAWGRGGCPFSVSPCTTLQSSSEKKKAPCCPEMVSVLSRLIQLAFGSGWERGCWSLLEKHICSLATGSKEANQMEGLQRASPGSQVSTPDSFQQISPPATTQSLSKAETTPLLPILPPQPQPAAAKCCDAMWYLHLGGLA